MNNIDILLELLKDKGLKGLKTSSYIGDNNITLFTNGLRIEWKDIDEFIQKINEYKEF